MQFEKKEDFSEHHVSGTASLNHCYLACAGIFNTGCPPEWHTFGLCCSPILGHTKQGHGTSRKKPQICKSVNLLALSHCRDFRFWCPARLTSPGSSWFVLKVYGSELWLAPELTLIWWYKKWIYLLSICATESIKHICCSHIFFKFSSASPT